MDLYCNEVLGSSSDNIYAKDDEKMSKNDKIIPNMLGLETSTLPSCNYFKDFQTDIKPYMRKVVTTWMMEVCEEQKCEEQVYPFAINLLDRFLCICPIRRSQLQVLGTAVLLLAAKIRQCNTLPIEILSAYTDLSVKPHEIRNWEILVLTKLEWHITAITAFDYVYPILQRVPWGFENSLTKQHAYTLISVCCTEECFIRVPPSLLASSAICTAMRELKSPSAHLTLADICRLTTVDPIDVEITVRQIESIVAKETAAFLKQQQQQEMGMQQSCKEQYMQQGAPIRLADDTDSHQIGKPNTPTDITDSSVAATGALVLRRTSTDS